MEIRFGYNPYVLAGCLFFLAVSAFFLVRKKSLPRLKALRFSFLILLGVLALNPALDFKKREYREPETAYVIDSSVYMRSKTGLTGPLSKAALAEKWLLESGTSRKSIFYAADRLYSGFPPGTGEAYYSDFEGALGALPSGYERIVYFTDGYSPVTGTDGKVEFVLVGEPSEKEPLRIEALKYPDLAFLHMPFNVHFEVFGNAGGIRTELRDNGIKTGSREFPNGSAGSFTVSPKGIGKHDYGLCAFSGAAEKCLNFSVNVFRDKLRIVYLSGVPNHGYYFLREYLKSNPSLDMLSFIILREPGDSLSVREDELSLIPFPREEIFLKDLFHFDVFVLEEFDFRQLAINSFYLDNVAKFVKEGGSLLLIGGGAMAESLAKSPSENFRELLPALPLEIKKTDYARLFPSPHPVASGLTENIPPLRGEFVLSRPAADSREIIGFEYGGSRYPLVSEKKYGKGRVVMINSMSLWQWKTFSAGEKNRYFYYDFYKNIFSWLDFTLDLKRADFTVSKTGRFYVNAYVLDENYGPLTHDGAVLKGHIAGKGIKLPLAFNFRKRGVYRAYLPPLEKGVYSVSVETSFRDGYSEKYSGKINLDENILYREGFSAEGLEKYSGRPEALKLSELKPGYFSAQKKEYYRVNKTFTPGASFYFLLFLVLFFSAELAFRRFKGEL
ncbi:MAG: hypothetical protein COT17_05400 [Elusimicrobia bacterium CG08_land_8_20_14_0_20_51_18]|nr:MAG: hypothetical protein COT17_05400 [Elusimicrobia bacterium CG08_land_8_20_14_0_20_51_18]